MAKLTPRPYLRQLAKAIGSQKVRHLPYLLPYTKELAIGDATRFSEIYARKVRMKGLPSESLGIEEALFFHAVAKRTDHLIETARFLRDSIEHRSKVTPQMYLMMLQGIERSKNTDFTSTAVSLYIELHNERFSMTSEDRNLAASLLLDIFKDCRNITDLLQLKIAYENHMTNSVTDKILEIRYIATFIEAYLNSGQYTRAVELFESGFADLTSAQFSTNQVLKHLSTNKMLLAMSQHGDVKNLTRWLEVVVETNRSLLDYDTWSEFLSLGLSQNHYGLVKLIYYRFIMLELDDVSLDEVMFSNKLEELENKSGVLSSLSEKTLKEILHTLASNGDVNSTLSLIEWHYVHKKLKGEKALTKDLCLDIILSYCYRTDETRLENLCIQNVLTTINNFTSKLDAEFVLSYRDICDAMSYRFVRYSVIDSNVETAEIRARASFNKAQEFEENDESKPRKIQNNNVYDSRQGNILKNSEILDGFVRSILSYILEERFTINTLRIFINCVLHHIMKYQNATGMIVALLAMHQIHPKMASEWLDNELFDIMIRTISKSPAAKLVGFEIYHYMRSKCLEITPSHYKDFIASASKGSDNELLQHYLHESLVSKSTTQNSQNSPDETVPTAYNEEEKVERKRYYDMDKRDSGYLKVILNEDKTN